jgi:hypothetical protein
MALGKPPEGGHAELDVPALLEAAGLLNDFTVHDIWDHLVNDEWEVALNLLEELGDADPLPPTFWQTLADAAEQLRMDRSAAWCHWRCYEVRHGVIRADLTLLPSAESGRETPVPGAGVLRPLWNTGNGAHSIARLWIEGTPSLQPGGRATVRLAPLAPAHWQHLEPGHRITMHEGRPVVGTAVILEVHRPAAATAEG